MSWCAASRRGSCPSSRNRPLDGTKWAARTSVVSALASALGATTCCTIPTLLAAVGLSGAFASAVSAIPVIGFISAHRAWLFVTTGLLLTLSWAVMAGGVRAKWLGGVICPPGRASPTMGGIWWVSVGVYGVGPGAAVGARLAG